MSTEILTNEVLGIHVSQFCGPAHLVENGTTKYQLLAQITDSRFSTVNPDWIDVTVEQAEVLANALQRWVGDCRKYGKYQQ